MSTAVSELATVELRIDRLALPDPVFAVRAQSNGGQAPS